MIAALVLTALFSTTVSASARDAYVLTEGSKVSMALISSDNASIEKVLTLRDRFGADFLWFRRDGREYLIRDSQFLARVNTLFAPMRALEPEQRAVSREESDLDRLIDAIEDRDEGERIDDDTRAHLRDLRARQRDVQRRERELDRREEAMEREAERALWRALDDAIRDGTVERLSSRR